MTPTPDQVTFAALEKLMSKTAARQGADAVRDALAQTGYMVTGKEADPSPAVLKLLAGIAYDAAQGAVERISQKLQFPAEIADAVAEYDAYSDLAAWFEYQDAGAIADDLRSFYLPIEDEVNEGRRALEIIAAATAPTAQNMSDLVDALGYIVGPTRADDIAENLQQALASAGLKLVKA